MASMYDGISQQLDFSSCGEEGSNSDNSSDECNSGILSPGPACRTPRGKRSRISSLSSSVLSSPIPYASLSKLRLCDSPSTPKVENNSIKYLPFLCICGLEGLIFTESVSNQFNISGMTHTSLLLPAESAI